MIYTWQVGQSHFGNRESLFWVHVRSNAVSPFVFWKTMVDSRIITRSRPSITNLGHASFRSTWHHISAALYYHLPGQPSTTVQRKRTQKKQVVPSDSFSTIQTLKGQPHMFEVPPKNPRWVPPDFPGVNGHFRYQFIGGTYHRFPNRRIPQHLHPVALSGTIVPATAHGSAQLKSAFCNWNRCWKTIGIINNGCWKVFLSRTLNGKPGKYETWWAAGALLAISWPGAPCAHVGAYGHWSRWQWKMQWLCDKRLFGHGWSYRTRWWTLMHQTRTCIQDSDLKYLSMPKQWIFTHLAMFVDL